MDMGYMSNLGSMFGGLAIFVSLPYIAMAIGVRLGGASDSRLSFAVGFLGGSVLTIDYCPSKAKLMTASPDGYPNIP